MSAGRIHLRRLLALLLLGVVAWAGVELYSRGQQVAVPPGETWPDGRWHRVGPGGVPDAGEAARLLSLPYVSGTRPASVRTGVTVHRPGALPGWNLYSSGHGPEALLLDMEGEVLHRWRYPFERAFPDRQPTQDTASWRRVRLLPDGSLLALFQGGGLIKLDPASRLLWRSGLPFYNDLHVDREGRIYGITKEARRIPALDPDRLLLEDFIVTLDRDGRLLERLSILEALQASPFRELLHPLPAHADIFHTNTIQVLEDDARQGAPLFAPGRYLVSMREIDTLALVDPQAGVAVWARRGPWRRQHEPVLVDGGAILLFDNQGAGGHSRVIELDPVSGEILWEYRGEPGDPLDSREAGACQRLANGNTLITESEAGRAVEVNRGGEIVWELLSPHRAGSERELVATLFEVRRLVPTEALGIRPREPSQPADGR